MSWNARSCGQATTPTKNAIEDAVQLTIKSDKKSDKKSYKTKKQICFPYSRRKLKCTKREDCPSHKMFYQTAWKYRLNVIKETTGCLQVAHRYGKKSSRNVKTLRNCAKRNTYSLHSRISNKIWQIDEHTGINTCIFHNKDSMTAIVIK